MPQRIHDTAMVRRNYHFELKQIQRLEKLARMEGTSIAALLREGGYMLIADRVQKLRAQRETPSA